MELRYHKDWRGNFGDDLNLPFFDTLAPRYKESQRDTVLYGIGTLLNDVHGTINNAIIFGSGFGYGEKVDWDPSTVQVLGVRGPLTSKALGISSDLVIGDPALYVPCMPNMLCGDDLGAGRTVVALHHRTNEMWSLTSDCSPDYCFLDPGGVSIFDYISTIKNSSLVLAESLHGAIIASAFGVPFVPISVRTKVDPTKWADFALSLGIQPFRAVNMPLPEDQFIRRLKIAAGSRLPAGVGKALFKKGLVMQEGELNALVSALKLTESTEDRVLVDRAKLLVLQRRIEFACGELDRAI